MFLRCNADSVYTDSLHPLVDTIATHLGYSERQYGAIIDAGCEFKLNLVEGCSWLDTFASHF